MARIDLTYQVQSTLQLTHGGTGVTGNMFADAEIPAGIQNSSNLVFTLAHSPSPSGSLQLVQNRLIQVEGAGQDYILSGHTITYAAPPASGDKIRAWYRYVP